MKTSKNGTIKKFVQRAISLLTGSTLALNSMYSVGFMDMFHFSTDMTAKADEEPAFGGYGSISEFDNWNHSFANSTDGKKLFIDYCIFYSTNNSFATAHQNDSFSIVFTDISDIPDTYFVGLGNASKPFSGEIKLIADNTTNKSNLSLPRALFSHVSTDAKILNNDSNAVTLQITKTNSISSPLLADYVHNGTNAADWKIEVPGDNTNAFAGVIGQIEEDADVTLEFKNASSAAVSNTASGENDIKDVGELCGIMETGSSLTVTDTTSARPAVTSANGNAGSLVGTMEGTASLTLASGYPPFSSVSVTSGNGYAGGLVGEMASTATITGLSSPLAVGGSVTGTDGAGGLYGRYTNSATTFDLKDYNITASVYAQYCGGVFGVLENNKGTSETALALTIKNTSNTGTVNVSSGSGSTYATTGCFGGIAGKYTTDAQVNSLILDSFSITAASNASFASFGGAIGLVDSAAYIKSDGMNITATGTAQRDSAAYFGGLIGRTSTASGVFVDLGNFTLTATDSNGFKGGGTVGSFTNGVLRLSGTTDMSSAKSRKGGQLVGENDNVLTYALGTGTNGTAYGSGWTFKRSNGSNTDDLGTWGEVVRGINDSSSSGTIHFNSTAHTAKIAGVSAAGGEYQIGTADDFTRAALNIQLNNKDDDYDCLQFTSGSADRDDLLSGTITLTANVSLAGTGITGFMRDGSESVGAFTGTLNGGSKTVTLAIGEKYGQTSTGAAIASSTNGEGLGQIYAHPYNGLFAVIGNGSTTGTVQSLTIAGTVNVRNTIDGMNIGGIAAVSQGSTSLSNITASQTVNYGEPTSVTGSETAGKNIGGLIGLANGTDNGTIAITGTNTISTAFNISNNYQSWNALGAFIGKVTSPKFTINIAQGGSDKLTVSHTMTDNSFTAGTNSDGGGLIGYITAGNYSDRKINIKRLDFNNCTIINKASTNGGGFLGYAWLDTDTTIDGLTVTDGTITNTSPNVGVMCYIATGRWKVNSLTVTKMSLSGGAGTSLGMLVNMAHSGNKGLYLDVLNAGYTLTDKSDSTGITLPNSLGIYDELAAYSAADVVKGVFDSSKGAGVISVNMNATRSGTNAKIRDYDTSSSTENGTGTYQNKLTNASSTALESTKYANAKSRYYYNLDVMSNSDAAQDIMLWSVNQYASANIADIFDCSDAPFDRESKTAVKLSSYSYYPVYSVSSLTLKNVDLEFGYNGIYAVESGALNTDSYNRDPSAQNQHYLMQSGLFINSAENTTLTLNTVELSGDFLENSTYQGVLISGTANGNISINGLVLDGIKPKYNASGTISNYTSGYLLVQNVNRENAFKANIQLNLKNISTSDKYTVSSATALVSKSLFGDVYGPAIGINIDDVKLDARSANGGLSALDNAYGTKNSIFTTATFFNSIKTTQAATMIYNYSWDKDWGTGNRSVTYGREVSESVEYEDKENKYDNDSRFTDPGNSSHTSEPEYNFSSWRPYVGTAYTANQTPDTNGCYYRELKVNVPSAAYPTGCGTYNDPYIIDSGAKLEAIAALINDADNTRDLASLQLPKTLYNGVTANTTGNRWCDGKTDHAVYTYDRENNGATTYTSADSDVVWSVENVRLYLANAYYSLAPSTDSSGHIELTGSYLGLGGTADTTDNTGKFAFRGVIVGNSVQIDNNSQNPLVKVSNGCVLKDLTVNQNVDVNVNEQTKNSVSEAYFGYNSKCEYYGGLIGEIMGGDNIIDNSYVKFGSNKVYLKGTAGTLVPVGGYVGVVVFGGLIFKNMDARKTSPESTGLNVIYKQARAGVYTVTIGGGDASEGDTFTVADKTYTVAAKDKKTPAKVAEQIKAKFNNHTYYKVTQSGAVLTFTENKDYYGTGQPEVDTTSLTTTITAAETTSPLSGNLAANTDEAWAAIYVNPIVGRVINGYAVNETGGIAKNASGVAVKQFSNSEDGKYHDDETRTRTGATLHTLKNGKKHYTIADLDPDLDDKLNVTAVAAAGTDGNINVPNAQALFVLSLIMQSCAGTATDAALGAYSNSLSYGTYDGNVYGMSHNAEYSAVGTEADLADDDPATPNIDETGVPDYQKLAYYDSARNATGNSTTDTNNAPIPYIIKKYTVGGTTVGVTTRTETRTRTLTREVFNYDITYAENKFTTPDDLDGQVLVIKGRSNLYMTGNAKSNPGNRRNAVLELSSELKNAVEIHFDQQNDGTYFLWCGTETNKKYLCITEVKKTESIPNNEFKPLERGNLVIGDEPFPFEVVYSDSLKYWGIRGNVDVTINEETQEKKVVQMYINCDNNSNSNRYYYAAYIQGSGAFGEANFDGGNKLNLYKRTITSQERIEPFTEEYEEEYEVTITDYTTTHNYPARCVTSTLGYYDITLTGSGTYLLPDSFRGLGCVGNSNDQYALKIKTFNGGGSTIDEDIYLNKFKTDNYFDKLHKGTNQETQSNIYNYFANNTAANNQENHGIGLFNSVITKGTTTANQSSIGFFTLTGSVNTEIYSNDYNNPGEVHVIISTGSSDFSIWHSVGGVVGWCKNGLWLKFDNINLNNLSVSGSDLVGGILGFSGTQSKTVNVTVSECTATNLSVEMTSTSAGKADERPRTAMGGFVGKVYEAGVVIYGTSAGADNQTPSNVSTVKIKSYKFAEPDSAYKSSNGGLVGYAGNGCKVYDMKVMPADGVASLTIGTTVSSEYTGGLVGTMSKAGTGTNTDCLAEFKNCKVQDINIAGNCAGGLYGGKWNYQDYCPYKIEIKSCSVVATNSAKTITAVRYAGGLIGWGQVQTRNNNDYNIQIADTRVSNYNISSNQNSGGFIGYCEAIANSITCYIHDSSVENCIVGGASNDYAGGAIGGIAYGTDKNNDNKLLGYNIKLDTVRSNSSNIGAWIGFVDTNDNSTSIQFTGLGVYGNGFTNNVGNRANFANASFVFADYDEKCGGTTVNNVTTYPTDLSTFNDTNNVLMPKYPYVNINPQSSMGTGEFISGDGAVLRSTASETDAYSGKPAEKTMALKLYEDLTDTSNTRRYTTFDTYNATDAAKIYGDNKIDYYMQRVKTDDGDRISNYYYEKGYNSAAYDNFACVVIANNTTAETTALINRYAQLVTNTSTDYAGTDAGDDYFNIVVRSCKLRNGTFVIDTSEGAAPGLTYSNGQFILNGSHADSLSVTEDKFTLVDIQFNDPLHTDEIAYHLYIPVYTIKEIEIRFSAAVMNGTNSVSYNGTTGAEATNPYSAKLAITGNDTHVDNLNTWYTTYLRYTYDNDDLAALLDSGNLNWSHNKFIYIDKTGHGGTSMLPADTYMILVDPNGGHDKKYQASLNTTDFARDVVTYTPGRITFDLTKFKDSSNVNFSVSTFNELIADKITVTDGAGHYIPYNGEGVPQNTGNTRYVYTITNGTKTYYQYVESGGTKVLALDNVPIYENYYISMYVPGTDGLYGYYIRTPDNFEAPSYPSGTNNAVTKSAKVSCYYGNDDRQVYVGAVFDQVTDIRVLPDDLEIDNGHKTLNIYATTTITPKDNNIFAVLNSVNTDIYHSFNLYLDKKDEKGVMSNRIYGLDDEASVANENRKIQAWYSIGTPIPEGDDADMTGIQRIDKSNIDLEDNYINVVTVNGGQAVLQSEGVTIYSRIRLDFDTGDLEKEFPQKVAQDTGVSVRAASNLAYERANTAFSSMSASLEEPSGTKHIYYSQSFSTATLKYFATKVLDSYDIDGAPSENYSRIGLSGRYSMNGYMPVDTTARYNAQNIENALGSADYLDLTLSLQKKTDTPAGGPFTAATYRDVSSINAYWGAVQRNAITHEVTPAANGAPITDTGTNLYVKCGSYDQIIPVAANTTTITLSIPKENLTNSTNGFKVDENNYIYIYVGFNAKTKDNFTEYANYKVNLTAKLRNSSDGDITGSYAESYLIYTNAKINHDFLNLN